MIVEGILDVVFAIAMNILPESMELVIPAVTVSNLAQFFAVVWYVLPMSSILSLLSVVILLQVFRIAVAVIKTIWALLPFA